MTKNRHEGFHLSSTHLDVFDVFEGLQTRRA